MTARLREIARSLEEAMGDARDPAIPLSFARAVESDEREAYPEEACRVLDRWGLPAWYVPAALGGRLERFDELALAMRLVARRDLTAAIAHGKTFIAAAAGWVGGSDAVRATLARRILAGEQVALAVHEEAHGSDVLAADTTAIEADGRWRLDGSKWLVNNATRGTAALVQARTGRPGDPRGATFFLLEKDRLAPGACVPLPRLSTHGVRGADFSGFELRDARVDAAAVVGRPGEALDLMIRAFQLTRTLIPSLSLGALDTALRIVLDFVLERRLYGARAWDLPLVRHGLVDAFVDLTLVEVVATSAARALHLRPGQMRLRSAIAKFLAGHLTAASLASLAGFLGARHYLRAGHGHGIFQKILRDHAVVPVFHAGSFLLLETIHLHLPDLARARRSGKPPEPATPSSFDPSVDLPPLDERALVVWAREGDEATAGLADLESRLGPGTVDLVRWLAAQLDAEAAALPAALAAEGRDTGRTPQSFDRARRYALLHAGAAAVHTWAAGGESAFAHREEWLRLALRRVAAALGRTDRPWPDPDAEALADELCALHRQDRLFSTVSFPLGRR